MAFNFYIGKFQARENANETPEKESEKEFVRWLRRYDVGERKSFSYGSK